jgi:Tol biopolymer transport system component
MAYSQFHENVDIWSLADSVVTKSPVSSTVLDYSPQFSPDGTRVAFSSVRSGNQEVWVANADGSDPVQLTTSLGSGSAHWSPDGRRIVYDTMQEDRRFDIRLIEAVGGQPTPIASHPANDKIPSFSRDGKWIYFSSNRSGKDEIYRVPVAGGGPVRLTDQGGWVAVESVDGQSIYYTKEYIECGPLFVRSLEGEDRQFTIRLLDPATGQSRLVGRTEERLYLNLGLTVSPDGKAVLFAASTQTGADLMLVENFR